LRHHRCVHTAGKHSHSLTLSYATFYLVGTLLATRIPVVGWTPFKSLEQLGSLLLLVVFLLVELSIYLRCVIGLVV
jgi:dolichyl-diphosphooligosaccharide--protein glycosyltransferase